MEEQCKRSPGYAIELKRLPPSIKVVRDPKHWTRADLTAFHKYILAGQRGELHESEIFQFRAIHAKGKSQARICVSTVRERDPSSTLKYTRGELLYGAKKAKAGEQSPTRDARVLWKGLPLARTSHVYICFRGDLLQDLMRLYSHRVDLCDLIREVARMEKLGPLHVSNTTRNESMTHNCF